MRTCPFDPHFAQRSRVAHRSGSTRPAQRALGRLSFGLHRGVLPGVLGTEATLAEESFPDGLLEYPHYTRPQVWEGHEVPAVLTTCTS